MHTQHQRRPCGRQCCAVITLSCTGTPCRNTYPQVGSSHQHLNWDTAPAGALWEASAFIPLPVADLLATRPNLTQLDAKKTDCINHKLAQPRQKRRRQAMRPAKQHRRSKSDAANTAQGWRDTCYLLQSKTLHEKPHEATQHTQHSATRQACGQQDGP
jgi:hypothetical protein